jgi:hypothetical protein
MHGGAGPATAKHGGVTASKGAEGRRVTVVDVVLAHQGGWDEMLAVLVPVTLFWLLLRLANRRARRLEESAPPVDGPD